MFFTENRNSHESSTIPYLRISKLISVTKRAICETSPFLALLSAFPVTRQLLGHSRFCGAKYSGNRSGAADCELRRSPFLIII
jgi:hypothetical protein